MVPQESLADTPVFCCNGCLFVYQLIHKQGLERFYELRDCPLPPVQSLVFQRRNFDWLPPLITAANGRLEVEIQGLSCIGCVWLIEKVFRDFAGTISIRVDPLSATAELNVIVGSFQGDQFAEALHRLGYLVGPRSENTPKRSDRALHIRLGVCAALAMNAMLFSVPAYCGIETTDRYAPLFARIALICGSLSMLVGATYFIRRAWNALRLGILHVDLPISLGLIAAYAGSVAAWFRSDGQGMYFDFVSMFTVLMLAGRWMRQTAIEKNRRRLLHTPLAVVRPQMGAIYSVEMGQVIPVRSLLRSQSANLGMEWINGEPDARPAFCGNIVPSGAINLSPGPLELEAQEAWESSLLSGLVALHSHATDRDRKAERFILIYLTVVLLLAFGGFTAWTLTGHPMEAALKVLISVLVVSCPCASGVALPLATEVATARLRNQGVFVRESGLWARLKGIRRIVFDKTGTLTGESPQLRDTTPLTTLDPLASSMLTRLVSHSLHPVATSLREHLALAALPPEQNSQLQVSETVGMGLEARHPTTGAVWRLGRPEWALWPVNSETPLESHTVLSCEGRFVAGFQFEEALRTDAAEELHHLQAAGLNIQILSGDHSTRVAGITHQLGLPTTVAVGGLTPQGKADWLRAHKASSDTLMIGDGANDSLAFEESLCCGTPAVDRGLLEHKADFFYLGRGLRGVRLLLEAAAQKERTTKAVLYFTTTYNVIAVALALAGRMHPLLAAILMPLSSVATIGFVLWSLRKQASQIA
jgi:Cu2+-exporting ATPase